VINISGPPSEGNSSIRVTARWFPDRLNELVLPVKSFPSFVVTVWSRSASANLPVPEREHVKKNPPGQMPEIVSPLAAVKLKLKVVLKPEQLFPRHGVGVGTGPGPRSSTRLSLRSEGLSVGLSGPRGESAHAISRVIETASPAATMYRFFIVASRSLRLLRFRRGTVPMRAATLAHLWRDRQVETMRFRPAVEAAGFGGFECPHGVRRHLNRQACPFAT
jgi:hypothetical protein